MLSAQLPPDCAHNTFGITMPTVTITRFITIYFSFTQINKVNDVKIGRMAAG